MTDFRDLGIAPAKSKALIQNRRETENQSQEVALSN